MLKYTDAILSVPSFCHDRWYVFQTTALFNEGVATSGYSLFNEGVATSG